MAKRKKQAIKKQKKASKKKSSTPKKFKTKRDRVRYKALDPSVNLKTRTDLIDYDYIDKLTEKEKSWLNKFTQEYVNAGSLTGKNKPLHKTKKLKQDCYGRNNARNRCVWTRQKASIGGKYLEDYKNTLANNPEEEMNRKLDSQVTEYHDEYNVLKESDTTERKVLLRKKSDQK